MAVRNLAAGIKAHGFLTRSGQVSTSGVGPGGSGFSAGWSTIAGIEVVDVESGAKSGVGFTYYTADYLESLGKAPGEGELDRGGGGFAVSGFRDVGGEKTVYNDGVNISISWVRQAVATFDLEQEALGHEEALLFNRCREHHIVPQGRLPARLAFGRQVIEAGGARRPGLKYEAFVPTRKTDARVREQRPNYTL